VLDKRRYVQNIAGHDIDHLTHRRQSKNEAHLRGCTSAAHSRENAGERSAPFFK
jgi:hypothetical protein